MPNVTNLPPGWSALPPELHLRVCDSLELSELRALGDVSRGCREVARVPLQKLDDACRKWLTHVEGGGAWSEPPRLGPDVVGVDVVGFGTEAFAREFPHLVVVRNLQAMQARLQAGADFPVTCDTCTVPGLLEVGMTDGIRNAAGEPEFVGDIRHPSGEYGIAFCSRDGTIRTPDPLRGTVLTIPGEGDGLARDDDAVLPHGSPALVVWCDDGGLAVYDVETDVLERLPAPFATDREGYRPEAAVSADKRYVAVQFEDDLLVYDRLDRQCVRDGQGDAVPRMPDSRYGTHLAPHEDVVLLVDRHAPDAPGLLLGPASDARVRSSAQAAAISRAGMMVAIAYGNRTLAFFDLGTRDGRDSMGPSCTMRLPPSAQGTFPSLLFSRDASHLDVVYRTATGAEFLRYALA